jgi:hypothetical protein
VKYRGGEKNGKLKGIIIDVEGEIGRENRDKKGEQRGVNMT